MRTSATNRTKGPKGFLIDLDYAQQLKPNFPDAQNQSPCITGTAPFMALEILERSRVCHTWRHDLESFFYVLIWLCVLNPYENLDSWVECLSFPSLVPIKKEDITVSFEDRVLNNFRQEFWPLKELALQFRDILFYKKADPVFLEAMKKLEFTRELRLGTPAGEAARRDIYDRVINIFDECIAILKSQEERGKQSGADEKSGDDRQSGADEKGGVNRQSGADEKGGDDRQSVADNSSSDDLECLEKDTTG